MKGLVALALLLVSCGNPSAVETYPRVVPAGLKDCHFFKINPGRNDDYVPTLYVVRCPLSSTTAQWVDDDTPVSTTTVSQ